MPDTALNQVEAQERASLISDANYDVKLDLTDDTSVKTFTSRTVVTFDAAKPGASTFIDLIADSVDDIVLNGKRIDASAFKDERIQLDDLAAHNTLEVIAQCNYDSTGVGLHRKRDPNDNQVYLYTQFEPFDAHRVFAAFDQPDLKAKFKFEVTAPPQWTIVNNEFGTTKLVNGRAVTTFNQTKPIAPYLAAVIAGPYKQISTTYKGIEITLYARASMFPYLQKEADEIFEITKQGLDYYEKAFGRPYPFTKYAHIFVPEFNMGAMENPGAVTYNESYLNRSAQTEKQRAQRAEVILHEMAHMWFGDLVTMKWWNDLWLNESFATVMALMAQMSATKFTRGTLDFANGDKKWALQQDQYSTTHPIASNAKDTIEAELNFDGITYAKGAAVLRQLIAWLGEDVVFSGLQEYFKKYEWSNATLNDLLTVWQKHAGPDRDVFAWAKAWLTTTGPNTLTGQRVDSQGRPGFSIVQAAAVQADGTKVFRPHRLVVGAYRLQAGKLVQVKRVMVDVNGAVTDVPELAGEKYDLLLVNDEDLTYAKIRLDQQSLRTATEHVGKIEDPLSRMLVWSSAWDMVRDAEMPARQYSSMVMKNIEFEGDPDTVDDQIDSALAAIGRYGDQSQVKASSTELANLSMRLLLKAKGGTDMQLATLRVFVGSATSPAQLAYVRDLYTGDKKLPQFDLAANIDMRWQMLTRLAVAGMADETMIDAMAQADPTNFGSDRAITAKAARPDAAIKADAWNRIVNDRTMSLKSYEALIGGFAAVDRDHDYLVDPYINAFVAQLPIVWKQRSSEEAEAFTRGIFPAYRGRAQVLALAEAQAKRTDLPPAARRFLAEIRDNIVLQAQAQALDQKYSVGVRGVA